MTRTNVRKTVKASVMRSINRSAILDIIRSNSPISRSEIAHLIKISLPTVMRVVDALMGEDLVRESGVKEASGGRPRPLLEFNGGAYLVVGIDLGGKDMFGMAADLSGRIQVEMSQPLVKGDPQGSLQQLCSFIDSLLKNPAVAGHAVRGIGIGAPGITDYQEGVVSWAPSLGWRNLPLKRLLSEQFGMPVLVENDVNLAALGEYGFGAGQDVENMVCLSIGSGVGAGIVMGGSLYRGSRNAAGEVGYLLPGVQYLGRRYEQFGAMESLASETAIAARARQNLTRLGLTFTADDLRLDRICFAAQEGEPWAVELVGEVVDYLSLVVSAVNVLLDPELIVLGGDISQPGASLVEPILSRLEGTVPSQPNLVASPLGSRATVMGAIMLVLNGTMENLFVERH